MDQEQALSLRVVRYAYESGHRNGAYWGLATRLVEYGASNAGLLTPEQEAQAASVRTRLDRFTADEQQLLLTAGYAHADAALRARFRYQDGSAPAPVSPGDVPSV